MKRVMENEFGDVKMVKVGFSWTTLFFGCLVPLFRGDWKWFLIMIIADSFTCGIARLIFIFKYNKFYISDLLKDGYRFVQAQCWRFYVTANKNFKYSVLLLINVGNV